MLYVALLVLGLVAGLKATDPACAGCNILNTCVAVGQQHTVGCAVYNCYAAGSYNIASYGCNDNGVCRSNGDTWNSSPCVIKSCTVTQNPWRASTGIAYIGCSVDGQCKNNSDTWNLSQCIRQKCVVTTNPYSAQVINDFIGCAVGSGCKAQGETWNENCMDKQCVLTENTIGAKITGAKCKDANGACHDPGQYFPYLTYTNCTCSVNSQTFALSYNCYANSG